MASNSLHNALTLPPLPDGWTYQELGDLLEPDGLSYGVVQPGSHDPEGVPILRVKNLHGGKISTDDILRVANDIEQKHHRTRLRGGEVLLSLVGSVGEVAVVPASLAGWNVARAIAVIRVSSDVSSSWIKLCLSTDLARRCMGIWQTDTVQATLNLRDVRRLPIVMPPKLEREAIAAVLGALDDKIAVNERIAQTALELGTAIYAHRASSAPTWRSVSLADAAQWYSGGTPRTTEPAYWNGHIPWISAISLKSPWIDDSPRKLTSLGAANGTRLVPPGAIIFVVRGSSLKEEFRIGIAQCEVAFGQDCKALVAVDGIDHDLLFHAIRHHTADILELVDETSIGAGRLATDLIEKLLVRVPDTPSDATVDALKSLNQSAAAKQRESRTLAELRDTLLPKLISGELRVRDAEKAVEEAL